MEENKNNHFEGFLNILNEQHNNAVEGINMSLFDDITKTAEVIEKTKDETVKKEIIENLRKRFKNVDLNQVTDLFIYNQCFFTSNENPLPMPSVLCISIGKLFSEENLHYTASKIYSKDEIEGGCALSFLGYLAMYEHHKSYVLNFIKENFEGFSQNKKTECVFQLKQCLPDDEIAKQIINDSGITKYELIFSTETDASSTPITFKIEKHTEDFVSKTEPLKKNIEIPVKEEKLSWWKFWKK